MCLPQICSWQLCSNSFWAFFIISHICRSQRDTSVLYRKRDVQIVNSVAIEIGVSAPESSHCKPTAENYLIQRKNTL